MAGYLHELSDWPRFRWDEGRLAAPLASARHLQGVVLGTSREGPKGAAGSWISAGVHVLTFRNGRIVAFEEPADVSRLATEFRRSQAHA